MITDEMIKTEFIHQTVSRDMKQIYSRQEELVRTYRSGGTGRLADFLSKAPFSLVFDSADYKRYQMRYLNYIRFLDIKYRRPSLYNRIIWGFIYNETYPELLHGLTRETKERIAGQFREIESHNSG